jgi:hypothetical protein
MPKLSEDEVVQIRQMYATGEWTQASLARHFEVGVNAIYRIVHNKSWVGVGVPQEALVG